MLLSNQFIILIVILFQFYTNLSYSQTFSEKHVSSIVHSKWSQTSLVLEASEFIHQNAPNSFWNFVDDMQTLNDPQMESSNATKTIYDKVIFIAQKHLTHLELSLLKLSLSIRAYSPTIEASRKIARESTLECITFVDINGKLTCDESKIEELLRNADRNFITANYKFEKFHPKSAIKTNTSVILYANIGSKEFKKFHEVILGLIEKSDIKFAYYLRHNNELNSKKVALSGYGVELDIKKTEYKAKDDSKINSNDQNTDDSTQQLDETINGFNFSSLKNTYSEMTKELDEFKTHLLDSQKELVTLKAWQMQDLSLQAAQSILDADDSYKINTLIDLAQNFPVKSKQLSKIKVRKELKTSFATQKRHLESILSMEAGAGAFYLNGLEVEHDTFDIFSLNTLLAKEAKLLESLHKVGLSLEQINELIYLDMSSKNLDYGVDIRDTSIQWLNDLENDKKYQYWGHSFHEILRPTYPGMLRSIAKNFFNLVFIVNPSEEEDKTRSLLKTVESFYANDLPIRIGFVIVTSDESEVDGFKNAAVALFRVHNYIKQNHNSPKALTFLTDLYTKLPKNDQITSDFIIEQFKRAYPKEKDMDDIFGVDSDYDEGRKLSMEYYKKIGLKKLPQVLLNGFPLKENELESDLFEESVVSKIMAITPEIQMSVYRGELFEGIDLMNWLMSKDTIMPRLNLRILTNERKYMALSEFDDESMNFLKNLKYLTHDERLNSMNLMVVCDPDNEHGRKLLFEAISFYQTHKNSRLALLIQSRSTNNTLKKAIFYALDNFISQKAALFISKIVNKPTQTFAGLKLDTKEVKFGITDEALDQAIHNYDLSNNLAKHALFISKNLNFLGNALIANSWIIGPFDENETFIDSDFSLLESFMGKIGLDRMTNLFSKWSTLQDVNNKFLMTSAILGKYSSNNKRTKISASSQAQVYIQIKPKKPESPHFNVVIILDPLTRYAQQIGPILKTLTEQLNTNLIIYFNCKDKLSALPLKSFFRYVLDSEMKFDEAGELIESHAYFENMPQTPVLTLNMHSPESWMVEVVNSPYDLDNIVLNEISASGAYGEFELEYLIIEGHAFDLMTGQSPRGLQFNLGIESNPSLYDTIVMANLGYFQLKASPGSWLLQLRDGRSKEIYEIVNHENTESLTKKTQKVNIVVDSFEAKIIKIKVSKKADKINENLLDEKDDAANGDDDSSLWSSLTSSLMGGGSQKQVATVTEDEDNVLNIFSVASGHLYERLLRIMMLTVLKNTKARVKFWFLKNYLSPEFTQFLPTYASEYKFDYELVQYKWPRWLHHESEKQRIIWAYKILFLDVLFPLNVKKIIFVDADQIVRADLTELRDMDLKGAPYGYVPFCDSRKEMEGYRFWKQGYWAMHLGHRRYHISALYVVDLKKFRKIAAGDRLRGQFQGLAQDPNSLSNLDQDLPNNMIHQVNIFSLPQEWLYCDTWCSSDTLAKAKTIDLCNNPMTKEPKLQAAMRIVPEWKDYDTELKNLVDKWRSQQVNKKSTTKVSTQTTSNKREEL